MPIIAVDAHSRYSETTKNKVAISRPVKMPTPGIAKIVPIMPQTRYRKPAIAPLDRPTAAAPTV